MAKQDKGNDSNPCPICGKTCTVAADGKSGHCNTMNQSWHREMVPVSELKPGPIQHANLPDFLLDLIRWTYKVVGHYIQPTLEQWELGFMRDLHVAGEVMFWFRVSHAFITYHRRKGMVVRSVDKERQFIGTFLSLGPDEVSGESDETKFIRKCFFAPDGWDEEVARVQKSAGAEDARWSPREQVKNWPE
jgi:hypothetical protein